MRLLVNVLPLLIVMASMAVIHVSCQAEYYCGPPLVNKTLSECPKGWYKYNARCYYFKQYPYATQPEASDACIGMGGLLLRIDSVAEFEFISDWLNNHAYDKSIMFYTSGLLDPSSRYKFVWQHHPPSVTNWRTEIYAYWLEAVPREGDGIGQEMWGDRDRAILGNNGAKWGFYFRNGSLPRPYICQAELETLAVTLKPQRDFQYGVAEVRDAVRSPCMLKQPTDLIYFESSGSTTHYSDVVFECEAYGNPTPTYSWYKINTRDELEELRPEANQQYCVSNGKLIIYAAKSSTNSGRYACKATNAYGSIMSRYALLSFGNLPSFPKPSQEVMYAQRYGFANIECKLSDNAKPRSELLFQFYYKMERDSPALLVRSETRQNLFVSQAVGRLYFSEVADTDQGFYYCVVSTKSGGVKAMKGPDTLLMVTSGTDMTAVKIAAGFPSATPSNPKRGDDVRLECVGYGPINRLNSPLAYSWNRTGGLQLPANSYTEDSSRRTLIIKNAKIEDSGGYQCRIKDGNDKYTPWSTTQLQVNSGPYFLTRPYDQFVDLGATARFECKAGASGSAVVYKWYRGTKDKLEPLENWGTDPARYTWNVTANLPYLQIVNVQAADAGSFGCLASNVFDYAYSFAELKVLSFAPSFIKNPASRAAGLIGKTVYLPCEAESAPDSTRSWLKSGSRLTVQRAAEQENKRCADTAELCEMMSGKLRILKLSAANAGLYTCVATNVYGTANTTIELTVFDQLSFDFYPENRLVLVNSTVDLPCQVNTRSSSLDVNYAWRFENTELLFGRYDFDARRYEATQFYRPYKKDFGTLRISNIQYDYEGNYTCVVQTPLGYEERAAYLRVAGPPGPCAGVQVEVSVLNSNFTVTWRFGATHQSEITGYVVEAELKDEPDVWFTLATLSESQVTKIPEGNIDMGKRRAVVSGLPNHQNFSMRVTAVNQYGPGEPSPPSDQFTTPSGPPSQAPKNVTGGGGRVRTLVVRWQQIPSASRGGANFAYDIDYRLKGEVEFLRAGGVLGTPMLDPSDHLQFSIKLAGNVEMSSYKLYELRVRGVSTKTEIVNGQPVTTPLPGPWSGLVEAYSAESLPSTAPSNVRASALNSTAVDVYWLAPANYDGIKGDILGYRIVYWPKPGGGCTAENNFNKVDLARRLTVFGKGTTGTVIGLEADTFYCFSVQVFNSAGDSAESSWIDVTTNKRAPSDLPTNIVVHSTGQFSTVEVTWNGVRQQPGEESVDGYMVRYWITGAPATNFSEVDAGMDNSVLVRKLSTDVRYDLRVYAYSSGGIGTFSSPVVQFMIIPKDRCVAGASWEAPDIKYVFVCSACRPGLSAVALTAAVAMATMLLRAL